MRGIRIFAMLMLSIAGAINAIGGKSTEAAIYIVGASIINALDDLISTAKVSQ